MNCFMCKGSLENKETTFKVEVDGHMIIVKSIPSHVCSQCGETSYSDDVLRQLERIVNDAKLTETEVAIANFQQVMVAWGDNMKPLCVKYNE